MRLSPGAFRRSISFEPELERRIAFFSWMGVGLLPRLPSSVFVFARSKKAKGYMVIGVVLRE